MPPDPQISFDSIIESLNQGVSPAQGTQLLDFNSLLAELQANRPLSEEEFVERQKRLDARGKWESTGAFIGSAMGAVGEFFSGAKDFIVEEAAPFSKALVRGSPEAKRAIKLAGKGGMRNTKNFLKDVKGSLMDEFGDYDQPTEWKREYQRYLRNYKSMQYRDLLMESSPYKKTIAMGEFVADPINLVPMGMVFSPVGKVIKGGVRKGIKLGAAGTGKLVATPSAWVGKKMEYVAGTPKRWTESVLTKMGMEGAVPALQKTYLGGAVLGAFQPIALPFTALAGAQYLGKGLAKGAEATRDVLKVFSTPSGQTRFLSRLAADKSVPSNLRSMAAFADRYKGTQVGDYMFNVLADGVSAGAIMSAFNAAAGHTSAEEMGQSFGLGFAMGGTLFAPFGTKGAGKTTLGVDKRGKMTPRSKITVSNYLENKLSNEQRKLQEQLPNSFQVAIATNDAVGTSGVSVNVMEPKELMDLANESIKARNEKALEEGKEPEDLLEHAPKGWADRQTRTIFLNKERIGAASREGFEMFLHEMGHIEMMDWISRDPAALEMMLDEFHDPDGEVFHIYGNDGTILREVTLNKEATEVWRDYNRTQKGIEIGRDAEALMHEIFADQYSMAFHKDPNVYESLHPTMKSALYNSMRRLLSSVGIVDPRTGNLLTNTISTQLKKHPAIIQHIRNYKKAKETYTSLKNKMIEEGLPVTPHKGQTSGESFAEKFGGVPITDRQSKQFVLSDRVTRNELKDSIEDGAIEKAEAIQAKEEAEVAAAEARQAKDQAEASSADESVKQAARDAERIAQEKLTAAQDAVKKTDYVGLGKGEEGRTLSQRMKDLFTKGQPDSPVARVIDFLQEAIDNRFSIAFGYRSGKRLQRYNKFYLRDITLWGWQISPKSGKFRSLKVMGWNNAVIRENVKTLIDEGFITKKSADEFMREFEVASEKALTDPEGRINPLGFGENLKENEIMAAILGMESISKGEAHTVFKNKRLADFFTEQNELRDTQRSLKKAIVSYDAEALAGAAPTGRKGTGFDYYNVKNNYMPAMPEAREETIPLPFIEDLGGEDAAAGFRRVATDKMPKSQYERFKKGITEKEQWEAMGNQSQLQPFQPRFPKRGERQYMPAAYHGTPHTFKAEEGAPLGRFRSSKIGTGEGAQAYGHGLYFAGKKEVAEHYRKMGYDPEKQKVNGRQINEVYDDVHRGKAYRNLEDLHAKRFEELRVKISKKPYLEFSDKEVVAFNKLQSDDSTLSKISKEMGEFDQIAEGLERLMMHESPQDVVKYFKESDYSKKAIKYFEDIDYETFGSLYKVELAPKENEYLLWDKPLGEQPKGVREKLGINSPKAQRYLEIQSKIDDLLLEGLNTDKVVLDTPEWKSLVWEARGLRGKDELGFAPTMVGNEYYQTLVKRKGSQPAASAALLEAGIPGIKYLEGASRAKGKGDYNYVIFDEGAVTITDKLFMPAAKNMQQAVRQGQNGDIPNAAIEISPRLADKLFMPAAAAYFDPGFSPETYVGKKAFPMMADRMKTGTYVTRSGKEFELRGGPDHPDMPINQGKVGWASMDGSQATQLQNAINRTDGVGLIVLMNEEAVASNRTFARILIDELKYDLENTPKAARRQPKQIRDSATAVRKWARKHNKDKYKKFAPENLKEIEELYPTMSFDARKLFFSRLASQEYKSKGGIFWRDLYRDLITYKNEDGYRTGDIVKVIQFEQGENTTVNLADLGISPDPTYDVSFAGKSISNVKGRVSAFQVFGEAFSKMAEEKPGRGITPEGRVGPQAYRSMQMRSLTDPIFTREMAPGSLEGKSYDPIQFKAKTGPERASLELREKLFMPAEQAGAPKDKLVEAARLWEKKGTDSPYFKKWFGKSKVVDEEGNPQVVYHGTKRDFAEFSAKYPDGLMFFAFDPEFAANWPEGIGGLRDPSPETAARAETLRKSHRAKWEQEFKDRGLEGLKYDDPRKDLFYEDMRADEAKLVRPYSRISEMESKADIRVMPVYLSVQKLFDPRKHYQVVVDYLKNLPEDAWVFDKKDGGKSKDLIKEGNYLIYERKDVIDHLDSKGFDGVIISESTINPEYGTIAVWNNKQIKSATGNRGTFDPSDPNIMYMPWRKEPYYRGDVPKEKFLEGGVIRKGVKSEELEYPETPEIGPERPAVYLSKDDQVANYFATSLGYENAPRKYKIKTDKTATREDLNRVALEAFKTPHTIADVKKKGWMVKKFNVSDLLEVGNELMMRHLAEEQGVKSWYEPINPEGYNLRNEGLFPTKKEAWKMAVDSAEYQSAVDAGYSPRGWSVSHITKKEVSALKKAGFDSIEGQVDLPTGGHEIAVFGKEQLKPYAD